MTAGLVTIVVPAKNEESGIGSMLLSLPLAALHASGFTTEVIVLDGHSRDATRTIARRCGALVLPDNGHGKSAAFREARSAFHGDYVVMLDADGTYSPDAIPRVVALLASGGADVVMGDRIAHDGAMTAFHRAGNAMLSLGATLLYGTRVRDLCTGLWGFRSDALRRMPLKSEGFALESELFALSARMHLRIRHTSVDYLPRTGESKITTGDGFRIGWCLVRNRFVPLTQKARPAPTPAGRTPAARTTAARATRTSAALASPEPDVVPIVKTTTAKPERQT